MATAVKELPALAPRRASRLGILWRSTVGKKALMAVTGLVLFLYVLFHMLGNLQVYAGAAMIDRYAAFLHAAPALLWFVRVILLAALAVHVVAGIQLWFRAHAARPVGYETYRPDNSSAASRTMIWSGILIFAFVVYHLLDLTVGVVHPQFVEGEVFHNVLVSFGQVTGVLVYLIAMVGLGFHLWHGTYSMFRSVGMLGSRLSPTVQRVAAAAAVIITLGFASIPIAVIVGLVG